MDIDAALNSLISSLKSSDPYKIILFGSRKLVFDAGRELWKYYHSKLNINVNASFYDIKEYFQGRDEKSGRMNNKSGDMQFNQLIANLRDALKTLAQKIEPKVYEYGFLKK